MELQLDRDTKLCVSLAGQAGSFGIRFHNFLFGALKLNYLYKSFAVDDLQGALTGVRALGIRGGAITMPFKEKVLPLLDEVDDHARRIGAVNTIVNEEGQFTGYNTDWSAVRALLAGCTAGQTVAVAGSGGMSRAVLYALRERGFQNVTVISRNESTGGALSSEYGCAWRKEGLGEGSAHFEILINATPIGMAPDSSGLLPFPNEVVEAASVVMDCVASPWQTPLVGFAIRDRARTVITGADLAVLQGVEQFALYTGVTPPRELVTQAASFALLLTLGRPA